MLIDLSGAGGGAIDVEDPPPATPCVVAPLPLPLPLPLLLLLLLFDTAFGSTAESENDRPDDGGCGGGVAPAAPLFRPFVGDSCCRAYTSVDVSPEYSILCCEKRPPPPPPPPPPPAAAAKRGGGGGGAGAAGEVEENVANMNRDIPMDVWRSFKEEGLLDSRAPTPLDHENARI